YEYRGVRYVSLDEFRHGEMSATRRAIRYFRSGARTVKWLASEKPERGDVVVAYHGHSAFVTRISALCRRHGAKLIADCTEWYDPKHVVGGPFGPLRLDDEVRIKLILPLIGRIIAISSYLESFFRARGCRTLRVPPLIDIEEP